MVYITLTASLNNQQSARSIAERIAMIVSGSPDIELIETPSMTEARWSVDVPGNGWWATWDFKSSQIKINSRYAMPHIELAVRTLLIYLYDLSNVQEKLKVG